MVGRQTAPKQVAVAPSPRPAPAPSTIPPGPEPTPPKPAERLTLSPVDFADLPGWRDDDAAQALPAFRLSCGKLKALPADRALHPGEPQFGTAKAWQEPCGALPAKGDAAATRA